MGTSLVLAGGLEGVGDTPLRNRLRWYCRSVSCKSQNVVEWWDIMVRSNQQTPTCNVAPFSPMQNEEPVWRRRFIYLAMTVFLAPICQLCRPVREGRSNKEWSLQIVHTNMKPGQHAISYRTKSPISTIVCSVLSQNVCHANCLNLWSTPFMEALSTMLLCCFKTTVAPLVYNRWYHHNPIFEFRQPHASLVTALTHQLVPSNQFHTGIICQHIQTGVMCWYCWAPFSVKGPRWRTKAPGPVGDRKYQKERITVTSQPQINVGIKIHRLDTDGSKIYPPIMSHTQDQQSKRSNRLQKIRWLGQWDAMWVPTIRQWLLMIVVVS